MGDNEPFIVLDEELITNYKLSKYNLYIDARQGLVFNCKTTAVVSFDERVIHSSLLNDLLELGIVVKRTEDETIQIKDEYEKREKYISSLHLIIAVTLDCQFRCFYCYENHPKVSLNDKTADGIISLISEHVNAGENITIDWYGGEPLIEFERITRLSKTIKEICSKNGVEYSANIITNGLLMTPDIISRFEELSIVSAQITLDGTKATHDKRRKLITGDSSFQTIFDNIVFASKNTKCNITLRINVDKGNIDEAYKLVKMFSQIGITDIDITLGMLKPFGCGQQCSSVGNLFSMNEFANEFLAFRCFIKEEGFEKASEKMQPVYKVNTCSLDAPNSYVVDPEGYMYKCISYVGRKDLSIGNILDSFDKNAHLRYSPYLSEKCSNCIYLPICKGACLQYTCNNPNQPQCDVWRFIVDKFINQEYLDEA